MALVPTLYAEYDSLRNNSGTLFKLTNKSVNEANIALILKGIQVNDSMTHFVFCLNELGDKHAISITRELVKKKNVHSIYFWANKISDFGFHEISKLIHGSGVNHLDFSRNLITNNGILNSFDYIVKNKKLIAVDLAYNLIENEGSKYIASVISNSPGIIRLNLSRNKITENGMKPWINILLKTRHLNDINFAGNNSDPSAIVQIKYLSGKNKKYRELCAKSLIQISRKLIILQTLPGEILNLIFAQYLAGFSPNEAKLLKSTLMTNCFVGWVRTENAFCADELIRRCNCLIVDRQEFEKLSFLIGQRNIIKAKYENIMKQRTEKRMMSNNSFLKEVIGYLFVSILRMMGFICEILTSKDKARSCTTTGNTNE